MDKFLDFLDVLPGRKTELLLFVQAVANVLTVFGLYDVTPVQLGAINGLFVAGLALAVGLRKRRNA